MRYLIALSLLALTACQAPQRITPRSSPPKPVAQVTLSTCGDFACLRSALASFEGTLADRLGWTIGDEETECGGGGDDVIVMPDKTPSPPPTEVDELVCLVWARISYLEGLVVCETALDPAECSCDIYEQEYCPTVEECIGP